jgi:histidine ammonia-lyase
MVRINGNDLKISDVVRVARNNEHVSLDKTAVRQINKAREMVDSLVKENKIVYGITTGFGKFSDKRISQSEVFKLQENLIKSHSAGTGKPLPHEVVRAMILLRINALARGYSGIRIETLNLLIELLNKNIVPWIPEQGSVGASGDLAPLAHMVLVLLGKGQAYIDDELLSGKKALEIKGLKAIKLKSKEGLALINGTQMMTALGVLAIYDSENISRHIDLALALSMEGLKGILSAFDLDLHNLRPHPGQSLVASNLRYLTSGSKLALYERVDRVQDAYSLRCAPQVHGASRDAIKHVKEIIAREINSVTDNPLLFPDKGKVISGGNFHGQPLALGLDYLGIALSEFGNISERRIARLIDSNLNYGLNMFLTEHGGLNSGYMIAQYTAASLVAENKLLANPASTDSIPTSANQEDHVSMGSISARKVRQIIENVEQIIAIELITSAQAIDLRVNNPMNNLGIGSMIIYQKVREVVEVLHEDRILYPELKRVKELVHSGILIEELNKKLNNKIF